MDFLRRQNRKRRLLHLYFLTINAFSLCFGVSYGKISVFLYQVEPFCIPLNKRPHIFSSLAADLEAVFCLNINDTRMVGGVSLADHVDQEWYCGTPSVQNQFVNNSLSGKQKGTSPTVIMIVFIAALVNFGLGILLHGVDSSSDISQYRTQSCDS